MVQIFVHFECSLYPRKKKMRTFEWCGQLLRQQNAVWGYFAEASKWSDISNLLSASASPTTVKEANEAVKSVTSSRERASREEVALNSKYASLHGN